MVAAYSFNAGSGSTLADTTGNHNDGTISFIDPDNLKVLETFQTDAGPETMVLVR